MVNEEGLDAAHRRMVFRLAKPGGQILADMDGVQAHYLHMAVGVSGEAGELLDAVKKLVIYQKPFTAELRKNIVEELGDLEFYMAGLRDSMGISREETLLENMTKLETRYAKGAFSNDQAQARADKAG